MGTHPIFESDFDCLTENVEPRFVGAKVFGRVSWRFHSLHFWQWICRRGCSRRTTTDVARHKHVLRTRSHNGSLRVRKSLRRTYQSRSLIGRGRCRTAGLDPTPFLRHCTGFGWFLQFHRALWSLHGHAKDGIDGWGFRHLPAGRRFPFPSIHERNDGNIFPCPLRPFRHRSSQCKADGRDGAAARRARRLRHRRFDGSEHGIRHQPGARFRSPALHVSVRLAKHFRARKRQVQKPLLDPNNRPRNRRQLGRFSLQIRHRITSHPNQRREKNRMPKNVRKSGRANVSYLLVLVSVGFSDFV